MTLKTMFRRLATAGAVALALTGAAQADQVTIGFTGPLSGGAALYGENTLDGLKMATKEINDSGGFKVDGKTYTINLVPLDDKYSPSQAAVNGMRLEQQYHAPVIFTPHSGGTFALQAFNERDNFLIMSYTSVPAVTQKGNKLTVKIPPSFTDYLKPFARITMSRYGKKLAVANSSTDYAKYWTREFIPVWEKMGGTVVSMDPMDYNGSADFYTGVSKALSSHPDVLFIGGASEPTGLVVKQARELGFKGGFVIMDQAKISEVAKVAGGLDALEGAVGVLPITQYPIKGAEMFTKLYAKTHKNVATSESAYHYFGMYLVVRAMQAAGTVTDGAKIRAAIPKVIGDIPPEHNPYEVNAIAPNGDLQADPLIAEVKNGKVVLHKLSDVK